MKFWDLDAFVESIDARVLAEKMYEALEDWKEDEPTQKEMKRFYKFLLDDMGILAKTFVEDGGCNDEGI